MSEAVIKVENLGKKYTIGKQKQEKYTALRDVIAEGAKSFMQKFSNQSSQAISNQEEFWALKDVSFEINQGDRVGIIGRNGAGKSTLLKVLSRITEPTTGRIKLRGRVASLLEVGTGFHPELTGRENIFLNGAILGMSRVEIKKKFDEIVAFAEVEKFLDTPVKRYSSGMYVRLAFAVAAHLEPEILIVDEVLAVGDVQFQKKCLGKMEEVGKEGRTVLFVSHNMAAIQSLCNSGILLAKGELKQIGSIDAVINVYNNDCSACNYEGFSNKNRKGSGAVEIKHLEILSRDGSKVVTCSSGMQVKIIYKTKGTKTRGLQFLISFFDTLNTRVLCLDTRTIDIFRNDLPEQGEIIGQISDDFSLHPGQYKINIAALIRGEIVEHIPDSMIINIESADFFGTYRLPNPMSMCLVKQKWRVFNTSNLLSK